MTSVQWWNPFPVSFSLLPEGGANVTPSSTSRKEAGRLVSWFLKWLELRRRQTPGEDATTVVAPPDNR